MTNPDSGRWSFALGCAWSALIVIVLIVIAFLWLLAQLAAR